MAPNVRLLAVSFVDHEAALATVTKLTSGYGPTEDVQIVPLGQASYPTRSRSLVVGHFADDVVAAVGAAVEEAGGRIEMDVPEDRAK